MAKLTLTDIANISGNPTSAEANINANSAAIEAALENTLSRDGSTPNSMNAALDMNSNRLINLSAPTIASDAATKGYVDSFVAGAGASTTVDLSDYGAVGDGVTDDLVALQTAWSAIVAAGGGTLVFGANKTYNITSVSFGSLFDCNGLRGVTVEGNGSQISMRDFTSTANIFFARNVQGLVVKNLRAIATTTAQLSNSGRGYRFCYATNSSQIFLENCEWQVALAGLMCAGNYAGLTPTQGPVTNVTATNIYSFGTYYPFNFQAAGDNVVIRARTINSGRAYFPWNVRDHDVQLYSEHGGPFDDVLLKCYCDTRHSYNKLENIKLRYSTNGRHSGAQTHQSDAALIAIDVQQFAAGFERGGQINNLDIEILVSDVAGGAIAPSRMLIVRRQNAAGGGDTGSRSHVFVGWKIRGRLNSCQNFTQDVFDIFSTINSYTWTGDYATNFVIGDLQGAGLSSQTFLRINGVPFNGIGRCLSLNDVSTDMQFNWQNYPDLGNVSYTNLYADNFQNTLRTEQNTTNGYVSTLPRQVNTGANVKMRDAKISYGATNFTGQFYADPVVTLGYNVDAQAGIADVTSTDPWGNGIYFENDYAVDSGFGGTATSGTTTTQVTISGKTWNSGQFINWTVYNVTRGLSAQITANAATTLTHAAIAGQTTGDAIQILRRDLETYIQFNDQVGSYRGIRPFMYTMDKGSAENHVNAKVISSATNATDAVFTTSAAHNLAVGDYVRFEGLTGGTWGTQLNNRSRRVKAVASTTTFSVEPDSTSFGTLTGGNAYWEPTITSVFYGDRSNGFEVRAPTYRGNSAPSGQAYGDNMYFRAYPGAFEVAGGNSDDSSITMRCAGPGSTVLRAEHRGANCWEMNVPFVGAGSSSIRMNVYGNAGAGVTGACTFYRNNSVGWAGMVIGNANFPSSIVTIGGLEAGVPTTLPLERIVQQSGAVAAAHTRQVYASDETTLQHFVDGVGNHVPRASALAVSATNGFQYVPFISGATVTAPTGVPEFRTGNYANSVPMVASHNTTDSTYRVHFYINGGWRTATLT